MPLIIGLTGGIGSGKTAVSDHFATLGIDVVDADVAARSVVAKGSRALTAIEEHFGSEILLANGELDRAALRQKVFTDPAEREWLEHLTHPLIRAEIRQGLDSASSPFVVLVSPLLIESGQSQYCDRILLVDVPEELQLARTAARDNNSEEQVRAIMAAQASRQQRRELADDILLNDGTLEQLQHKTTTLYEQYLSMADGS